jgi:ribosome-associated heat shock protein Hsp15
MFQGSRSSKWFRSPIRFQGSNQKLRQNKTSGTAGTYGTIGTVGSVRLDQWLDIACLYKTRSEAQKACKLGKVAINGSAAKPHREVRVGDKLEISRPLGRKQLVTVLGLAETHVARAEARLLYEDRTPKPTPQEIEVRRLERIYRAAATPPTRPDRDMRRTLRRLKRGD